MVAPPEEPRAGRRTRLVRSLALSVTVVLGGALAIGAWADPAPATEHAALRQAAPQQPPLLPFPTSPPADECTPNSPDPTCHFPTGTPRPSIPVTPLPPITELPPPTSCFPGQIGCVPGGPSSVPRPTPSTPCVGEDCIPQPTTAPPNPGTQPGEPGTDNGEPDCGLTNITGCLAKGINIVFRDLVKAAMDPVIKLLGDTAFTTPTLDSLPGVANLWNNSWLIVIALYGGLIMIGGIIVMAHESVQSRYSIKEIGPRLVVSFLASALSLFVIDKVIRLANALSAAVLGDGVDPPALGGTLTDSINGAISTAVAGGLFLILLQLVLVIAVVALLLVYVVRVVITLILTVSAPLWVACHALPHTDGIARWCERALGATLAIQIAQSLTLIVATNTFLSGGVHLFKSVGGGLGMLFTVLGLLYILFKIPSWFLSATKLGSGRSFLGGLVKAVIAAKTFGAVAGGAGSLGKAGAVGVTKSSGGSGGGRGGSAEPPWPSQPRIASTPDAVSKRLQQQYDAERTRTAQQSRLPSQEPQFLQPGAQHSTHDPAVSPAAQGRSAMPEFSAAPPRATNPPPPPSARRRGPQPGTPPRFQAPRAPRRDGQSPARPIRVASVPPQLRFQAPTPAPERSATPTTPPTAVPVFRPATPETRLGDGYPRTHSVPPVAFRPPTPKSAPRGGEKK
jgi:hypothetical protein